MQELQFFEETAKSYDIDLTTVGLGEKRFGPNQTTKAYIELFDSFSARSQKQSPRTLFDGLVVLWGTEKAYLDAWSYASQQKPRRSDLEKDLDGGALREKFIPNWTSQQFQEFVKEIQDCLEAYAESQSEEDSAEATFMTAAAMFKKVLALEENFWPVTAEDDTV
ncbi:hypothetical protein F5Y19DRAFT_406712 [Xylariaceae sp. FL1651]|nr:hypothetical protein F5Y19DRAFT_406712 [Xylariaceae sp. FL1651]